MSDAAPAVGAPDAASDSSAAGPALAAAASAEPAPPADLVQADHLDFVPGAELFVRGKAAVCVRFDYPHVYWHWASDVAREAQEDGFEAPDKHRSCSGFTQHMFQVRAGAKRTDTHDGGAGNTQDTERLDDTSGDEDDEEDARRAQHYLQQQPEDEEINPDAEADAEADAPPPPASDAAADDADSSKDSGAGAGGAGGAAARASLMGMFARRPEKAVFSGLSDAVDEEVVPTAAPQSVSIESCSRTRFSIPHKVSQLTLLNCADVEVTFRGVISSVELIRCQRCTLHCLGDAHTYTLDESDSCSIFFQARQGRVMFVSTENSARTVLTAQPSADAGEVPPAEADAAAAEAPADIPHEVRFVIEPPSTSVVAEDTPAPVPAEPKEAEQGAGEEQGQAPAEGAAATPAATAPSASPKQYQTIWQDGAFSTRMLERQGPLGYFSN